MKLITLTLPVVRPENLKWVPRTIELTKANQTMQGWIILVRGPRVVLIPPKDHPTIPGGLEIARSECTLGWDSTDPKDYEKQADYTSDPLPLVAAPEPAKDGAK